MAQAIQVRIRDLLDATDWQDLFVVYRRILGPTAGLLAIWCFFWWQTTHFMTPNNISNIMLQASNVIAIAIGFTVALIAAEIDLSIGALQAAAGAVAAVLMKTLGAPVIMAVLVALLVTIGLGLVSGAITWRLGFPSFIVTLAMLGIAQGGAFILTNGRPVNILPDAYRYVGVGRVGIVPVPVIIVLTLAVLTHLMLHRTRIGRHIVASGGDADAARLAGIPTGKIKMLALGFSGFTAGIGGLILSARLNAGDGRFGEADLLIAVAAVVIGGTSLFGGVGTIAGSVIGAVMLVSIKNGMVLMNIPDFWQRVVVGCLIIAAMVVDQYASGKKAFPIGSSRASARQTWSGIG